jgi:hypothetical protein
MAYKLVATSPYRTCLRVPLKPVKFFYDFGLLLHTFLLLYQIPEGPEAFSRFQVVFLKHPEVFVLLPLKAYFFE